MNTAQSLPASTPSDNEILADEISSLAAHIYAATYRFLMMIREFDDREAWAEMGSSSCAHWLNWRCGINLHTAREKLRVAHALKGLEKISAAFERGKLSYSKARAISRIANEDNEDMLLNIALSGTASQLERVVRCEIRCEREADIAKRTEAAYEHREFSWHTAADGSVEFFGRLPAELAEHVIKAIEANLKTGFEVESKTDGKGACDTGHEANRRGGGESRFGFNRRGKCERQSETDRNRNCEDQSETGCYGDCDAGSESERKGSCESQSGFNRRAKCESQSEADRNDNCEGQSITDRNGDCDAGSESERKGSCVSQSGFNRRAKCESQSEADSNNNCESQSEADRNGDCDADLKGNCAGDCDGYVGDGSAGTSVDIGKSKISLAARRADALVALCNSHCDGYEVTLHVPAEPSLHANSLENTGTIPMEAARRICCDAAFVPVTEDDSGQVLDIGRRTRKIPPAIRRALEIRDKGCCRFPGCTHTQFLKGHHIEHWAQGGKTSLDNLVLLCLQHHQLVHEGGFLCKAIQPKHGKGINILFGTPNGVIIPDAFAPKPTDHRLEDGQSHLNIHAQTSTASDVGTPLDVNTVIDALTFIKRRRKKQGVEEK